MGMSDFLFTAPRPPDEASRKGIYASAVCYQQAGLGTGPGPLINVLLKFYLCEMINMHYLVKRT